MIQLQNAGFTPPDLPPALRGLDGLKEMNRKDRGMTRAMRQLRGRGWLLAVFWAVFASAPALAGEFTLKPIEVADLKAVYAQVQTRDVVPARARIGGTLVSLEVTEGSYVETGKVVAVVVDDKLALQLRAADARRLALQSELTNAKAEAERAASLMARGVGTQQRVDQTTAQVEVLNNQIKAADAERAVLVQQSNEGNVAAPTTGRVLKVPVTKGAVLMPGEPVATIAGGGFYLRLALPERHAPLLREGSSVAIDPRAPGGKPAIGKLVKVYPQIDGGRVSADVEVADIGDFFVGERRLVHVPIAMRPALAVPPEAVMTRAGIDLVRLKKGAETVEVAVIVGPRLETPEGVRVEILSGLLSGDVVVTP